MRILEGLVGPVYPPDVFVVSSRTLSFFHFDRPARDACRLAAAREVPLVAEAWSEQVIGRSPADPAAVADAVDGARKLCGGRLSRASLVLPDSWGRVFLVDFEEPPGSARETDEMVTWKLRKLLPFRPEDLRFVWMPVGGTAKRMFVVGVLEKVVAGIEAAFAQCGVRIGAVEFTSLLLARLSGEASGEFLLTVEPESFHILQPGPGGVPRLFRSKRFAGDDVAENQETIRRELGLTATFLGSTGETAPASLRTWVDPDAGSFDLAGAASALPGAPSESIVRIPSAIAVDPVFPASLVARAPIAAAAFLGREGA